MTASEVRTNPFISVMPHFEEDRSRYIIRDFHRNRSYEIPNYGLLGLLGEASEWIEREELKVLAEQKHELSKEAAESVVEMLESKNILASPDSEVFDLERERKQWEEFGWGVAFDYYVCIRDYPYYDDNDSESILERVVKRSERHGPPPALYKEYEDVPRVELGEVDDDETLESIATVLAEDGRKPTRNESTVDAETLSEVLFYSFGETGRQTLEGVGEFLLKTSPSGGSRHPTEAYVAVLDVDGIERGVYHYSVKEHGLERIGTAKGVVESLRRATGSTPSFVVVFTSVLARDMWKYRDPRAFRIPNHDVGHLMETFRLVCVATDLNVMFEQEFDKQQLAAELEIDRLTEPILVCASVY
ncbi:SagB/ThcOx family dehydrogenase [Halorussus salilacus]|uniref:SagB family peptide dehydrogenase n=1 Tax=Halorussus salilacus TaxID=2953750 RepID=UPI0020A19696|nr:SagB family peptide dehydrogenase [Halorussus salilacus]USZ66719.1 SagB/ThcOx family dehydrogenase [Halorussus salilacus]